MMIKNCFQYSVSVSVLSGMLMSQILTATIFKGFAVILVPRWLWKHGDLLCLGIQRLYALEVVLKLPGVPVASGPDETDERLLH